MSNNNLPTLELDELESAHGGKGFFSNAWNAVKTAVGYGAPPGVGEAAGALGAAPGVIGVAKQGQARNNLINELAKPNGGGAGTGAAFNKYHNGPAARYSRGLINQ